MVWKAWSDMGRGAIISWAVYATIFLLSLFPGGHPPAVVLTTFPGFLLLEGASGSDASAFAAVVIGFGIMSLCFALIGAIVGRISRGIKSQSREIKKKILFGAIIGLIIALGAVGFANMGWLPLLTKVIYLGLYPGIGEAELAIFILSVMWIVLGSLVGFALGKYRRVRSD